MVLFLLLTLFLQKDEVVLRSLSFETLGSFECVFVLGSCSSWRLLDSASELLSGLLELYSGATDTS